MSIFLNQQTTSMSAQETWPDKGIPLFTRLRLALRDRMKRRKMTTELQNLDDKLLADIGLHRSQIPFFVAQCNDRQYGLDKRAAEYENSKRLGFLHTA